MRSFFVDIPAELDEAARIDGCNNWQAFCRVVLPGRAPGLAVTTLFSLLLSYNEFLVRAGADRLEDEDPAGGHRELRRRGHLLLVAVGAGAIGISLPILVFILLMQRHLVRGLAMGAVK